MMLKDSSLNLPQGQPVEATLIIDGKSFVGLSARVLGNDEIGVYPQHGAALALALGNGASLVFKSPVEDMEFPFRAESYLGSEPAVGGGRSASSPRKQSADQRRRGLKPPAHAGRPSVERGPELFCIPVAPPVLPAAIRAAAPSPRAGA
jgi:hypothetical protein